MDKQVIEKIALEERNALEHETKRNIAAADWDIQALVTRCFARIDAERGKLAIGYIRPCDIGMSEAYISDTKAFSDWLPLFLSPTPTIPEGMALVPIETLKLFPELRDMVAATQGERK